MLRKLTNIVLILSVYYIAIYSIPLANAAIYYVEAGGNDSSSNPGTSSNSPLGTIDEALARAKATLFITDTIKVKDGYSEVRDNPLKNFESGLTLERNDDENSSTSQPIISYMWKPDDSDWEEITSTSANDYKIKLTKKPYNDITERVILCSRHDWLGGGLPLRLMTDEDSQADQSVLTGDNQWSRKKIGSDWWAYVRLPAATNPESTQADIHFAINSDGAGGNVGLNTVEVHRGANNITLRGLTIDGGFHAVRIIGDNATIESCTILNIY